MINGKAYVKRTDIFTKREEKRSWIYNYGLALTELDIKHKYWACSLYDRQSRKHLFKFQSTINTSEHLHNKHGIRKDPSDINDDSSSSGTSTSSSQPGIGEMFGRPFKKRKIENSTLLTASFSERFKDALIR
jgi:hypothetical protein